MDSVPPHLPSNLGSRTSGVDGSSEGGRINTVRLPTTLVLLAMPLIQRLRRDGYQGRLSVEPVYRDGSWLLELKFEGPLPKGVPERWQGHRVVVKRVKASA